MQDLVYMSLFFAENTVSHDDLAMAKKQLIKVTTTTTQSSRQVSSNDRPRLDFL